MFEDLRGRVAVVTGGGRGLGLEMADALAEQGAHLALLDLSVDDAVPQRIGATRGVDAAGFRCDVTDVESIAQAFDGIQARLGTPGILVNAAGIASWADSADVPADTWRKVVDVNVPQHQAAYNASKAGVDQLTRSLAVEWADRGIRVNAIAPGYFLSDMTRQFVDTNPEIGAGWRARIPVGRMGEPADLRGLVTFLASDASRYVVGESIVIDGGYSII